MIARCLVVAAPLLALAAVPAAAGEAPDEVGTVDPAQGSWSLAGHAPFYFGDPGDLPLAGDWDCDGVDTPGLYRPTDGYVYLRNSNTPGIADVAFFFGDPGDVPVAGDFDGDGCDTVSVYRPADGRVFVVNRLGAGDAGLGAADHDYHFGDPGDVPFAGDFDGDGVDSIGVFRRSTGRVHLRNDHRPGAASLAFAFGDPGDLPVAGDWDGDGVDTVGVFRPADARFYLKNGHRSGPADVSVAAGDAAAQPVAGRFAAAPAGAGPRDPAFGTLVTKLHAEGWESPIYSQLQAFSPDERYLLTVGAAGYRVRSVPGFEPVRLGAGWFVPRWHPALPHHMLSFDPNDDDRISVRLTDVATGATSDVYAFPPVYRTILANQSFDEPSRDGRWLAGMAKRADGEAVIFALDLHRGRLAVELAIGDLYGGPCAPDAEWGEVEPDWVGISPLGRFLVVQWVRDGTSRCSGLETFDLRTGGFVGRVMEHHGHGDLGLAADGTTEIFMTTELAHPDDPNNPSLAYRVLPGTGTAAPPVHLLPLRWANAGHVSCQGPAGQCLVSYGGWDGDGWRPFEQEVWVQHLDGSVRRVAHHRSTACGYWVQPRATISASGRWAIYASDGLAGSGTDGCRRSELGEGAAFVVDLAAGGGVTHRDPVTQPLHGR